MSLEQDGFDICELDWQIAADAKVGDTYAFKVHDDVDGASATPISHAYPARTDTHGCKASCLRNACPQGNVAARARFESGRHRSSLRPAPCRTAVGQAAAERRPCDVPTPRRGQGTPISQDD